ncbi:MAG: putative DNA replication protein [Prokaryotic dsDNA virus sp.]|nr:MAG: putative DNA replication protein [Prokaryotic dsDNA virus sp.]|tara:strand:+ start:30477 stop:31241 length:765 start_codon:yes stop_codon:yes gene_type:complete
MAGWISLHRKILDNPILADSSKYNKKCAWIWLLLKANHKDNKFVLGNDIVFVKRGSFITSQKKLCKEFKWGNSKIRSFLNLLQKDGMIKVKTTSQSTHITICNYDTYQDNQITGKPQVNQDQTDSKPLINTNNNDNNNNKVNKVNNILEILSDKIYLDKYGKPMLQEFIDYWCEESLNGKKKRYQKEKTFSIDRRLQTWAKRDYSGYYKKHKEDLINKEQEEYYRRAEQKVSEEDALKRKQEFKDLTSKMFKKI